MRDPRHIRLSYQQAVALREAMRPLSMPHTSPINASLLILLCEKVYDAILTFETEHAPEVQVLVTIDDMILVNHFLSSEDGEWADDLLRQSRDVLHELRTGHTKVYLADPKAMESLLREVNGEAAKPNNSGAERCCDEKV